MVFPAIIALLRCVKAIMIILFLASLVVLLAGCATPEPVVRVVEINVPVAVRPVPPEFLLQPDPPAPPIFVAPDAPGITSALTPEGERALRAYTDFWISYWEAWTAWATE